MTSLDKINAQAQRSADQSRLAVSVYNMNRVGVPLYVVRSTGGPDPVATFTPCTQARFCIQCADEFGDVGTFAYVGASPSTGYRLSDTYQDSARFYEWCEANGWKLGRLGSFELNKADAA